MRSWLTRVVTALVGILLGALAPAPALATASEDATYTYDLHVLSAATPHSTTDRGPPTTYDATVTDDAVDRGSRGSSTRTEVPATEAIYDYSASAPLVHVAGVATNQGRAGVAAGAPSPSVRSNAAANAATRVDIAGARLAQKPYSEMFSSGGRFAGQSIDDVAGALRSGALSPSDVPIDVIARGGNSLILNTRSSAGIPRSSWNVIDRTGQAAYEARLTGQLTRNGLTSYGTELP